MNKTWIVFIGFALLLNSGCVWKSFGRHVASIEKCDEYDQHKLNIDAVVSTAKQLKFEGKLTNDELIEIDQEAALYSKRIKDLCEFFINGRINFEQYQTGMKDECVSHVQLKKEPKHAVTYCYTAS